MARIAIIGSRSRVDRLEVENLVLSLAPDSIVISGGADGPDTWAEDAARRRGLGIVIFRPDLDGVTSKFDVTKRYHARNQQIADAAEVVYAFVATNRKGGTEDTIKRAERRAIPVHLL